MLHHSLLLTVAATISSASAAALNIGLLGPDTSCGNVGVQYGYYTDNYTFPTQESYDGYDPTVLKHSTELKDQGVTGAIQYSHYGEGGDHLGTAPYNQSLPTNKFAMNYRGYVYAQFSGYYQFIQGSQDIYFLWVGDKAYSGWGRANANAITQFNQSSQTCGSGNTFVQFTAGNYYPFRVVYKAGAGDTFIDFNIIDAQNNRLLGSNTNNQMPSKMVVQYSCDGTSAPPFPAYGSET